MANKTRGRMTGKARRRGGARERGGRRSGRGIGGDGGGGAGTEGGGASASRVGNRGGGGEGEREREGIWEGGSEGGFGDVGKSPFFVKLPFWPAKADKPERIGPCTVALNTLHFLSCR